MPYNYDEDDYYEEKNEFIKQSQQKVWDLWVERYLRSGRTIDLSLKKHIAFIVQDWTGHLLLIDVDWNYHHQIHSHQILHQKMFRFN